MVAMDGEKLAGYIFYFVGPTEKSDKEADSIHIASIAVYPEYRRRGIADQLIKRSIEERPAWSRYYSWASLHVRKSNQAALMLYIRRGFTIVRLVQSYYEDGEDGLFLRKPIY